MCRDRGGGGGIIIITKIITIPMIIIYMPTAFYRPLTRIAHSLLKAIYQQSPHELYSAL